VILGPGPARWPAALIFCILFLVAPGAASAQESTQDPMSGALRVFLDCRACDFDYLRREIAYVDYVRDRKDAEVHVLVTTRGTGGGGTEFTFNFIGLGRFAGIDDELKVSTQQTDTGEERRRIYTRVLQLGLIRYVTSTPSFDHLHVVYRGGRDEAARQLLPTADPWNFWTFRVRGSGSLNGERSSRSRNLSSSFSANRTTEAWKVATSGNLGFRRNEFTLSDGRVVTDRSHDHNANALVVKSLGPHWAAAVRGRVASATFLNQDLAARIGGGVEYSVFPYAESSRRELIFQLTTGINHFDYTERTVFGKDRETVGDARFEASLDVRQPWGSSGVSFETAAFLPDPSRYRLAVQGDFNVRLFRGLSVNMDGSWSRINNQLHLRAGSATDEEILLRRRQLATSFRYRFSAGLSYTFGSIFNNVVNTRF
jgi:hypothetical protein